MNALKMLGGKLTIESSPGKGTSIVVEVPDGDSNFAMIMG